MDQQDTSQQIMRQRNLANQSFQMLDSQEVYSYAGQCMRDVQDDFVDEDVQNTFQILPKTNNITQEPNSTIPHHQIDHFITVENSQPSGSPPSMNSSDTRQNTKEKKTPKKLDYEKMISHFTTKAGARQFSKEIMSVQKIQKEIEEKKRRKLRGFLPNWTALKMKNLGGCANLIAFLKQVQETSYISQSRLLSILNPQKDEAFINERLVFKEYFLYFLTTGVYSQLMMEGETKTKDTQAYNAYCNYYIINLIGMPFKRQQQIQTEN